MLRNRSPVTAATAPTLNPKSSVNLNVNTTTCSTTANTTPTATNPGTIGTLYANNSDDNSKAANYEQQFGTAASTNHHGKDSLAAPSSSHSTQVASTIVSQSQSVQQIHSVSH